MNEIAPGVYRLGSRYVNWYLLSDRGHYTIVDSGVPGYWDQLPHLLESIGASLGEIEAVLLTHSHADHTGNAERLRTAAKAPVMVHTADLELVQHPTSGPPKAPLWRPAIVAYFAHLLRNGITKAPPVVELETFADGETLDVPGRPRVIHAPGHTPGSCALYVPDRGLLFAGDVLLNRNPLNGAPGPRIGPGFVNADSRQALESLRALDGLAAGTVLFGHGEPWTRGMPEALQMARRAGVY